MVRGRDRRAGQRQPDEELAAGPGVAHRDLARVRLDDAAGDAQPQSSALLRAGRAGRLPPEGHVEDARQILGRDTAASVGHAEVRHPLLDVAQHLDRAVGGSVPDRVDDQVAQGPPELGRIGVDGHAADRGAGEPDTLGPCHRLGTGEDLGDQIVEPHRAARQPERSGVNPGQLEQVVDHDGKAVHLATDLGVIGADLTRIDDHLVLQGLGHRPQSGQRGTQVVADPGDQLTPARLQGALAVPRLGQALVGGREPVRQPGQLGGQRHRRRDVQAAVADLLHRREQLPAGLRELPADQQGHGEPGQAGDGHQLQHDLAVAGVAHHDDRDATDTGDGRNDRHGRDERNHRADGAAGHRAQRHDPDDGRHGPDRGRGLQHVQQIRGLHAGHDFAGRREDARHGRRHQAASGS